YAPFGVAEPAESPISDVMTLTNRQLVVLTVFPFLTYSCPLAVRKTGPSPPRLRKLPEAQITSGRAICREQGNVMSNEPRRSGRHFLQIPGPTPVPERILSAMSRQVLDHRGPEFQKLGKRVLTNVKSLFRTTNNVVIYPSSGTGAWEASLVNTLSPGDHVLMVETGQFAVLWASMATKLGLKPEVITTDWHAGVDADL